ncbi:MAG: DMT family transporter [Alphaproteobacteria bacterium]
MSTQETRQSHRRTGALLTLAAAISWSTAGLAVRSMDGATAWQILCYRSLALFAFLVVVLLVRHRSRVLRVARDVGWAGVLGAFCMVGAFMCNILAMTMTTIANAAFLQATQVFFGAALGWIVLGEAVPLKTWIAMVVALGGVALMMGDGLETGTLLGNVFGLATGFWCAAFAVSFRFCRGADNMPIACLAAILAAVATAALAPGLAISTHDVAISLGMGIFQIGIGMVLFGLGARRVPAAELLLIGLVELVVAPIWVWLIVGEVPSTLTLGGGALVLAAVVGQVLVPDRRVEPRRVSEAA